MLFKFVRALPLLMIGLLIFVFLSDGIEHREGDLTTHAKDSNIHVASEEIKEITNEGFRLISGIPLYDSMHELAMQTVESNIAEIDGKKVLKAGEEYGFWTRDTAYNALLAAALIYPEVAKNSLKLCVGVGGHAQKAREHALTYESKTPPKEIEEFVYHERYGGR